MPVDAIVRVSFQSNVKANQEVNLALVGHRQEPAGSGPFQRVNTALFECIEKPEIAVATALRDLGNTVLNHAEVLDFMSVTVVRRA